MFRLSRETDYGLLAMVYIAGVPPGQLAYRRDIAAHYNIPAEFLAKILQKLARGGLVRSFRGVQGGYNLARGAEEITVIDVVEAVEGPLALVECQCPSEECSCEPVCTISAILLDLRQRICRLLGGVSLQDIIRRIETAPREKGLGDLHP
ncbi:MAG: RrF2 family transcriptional regulator [Acidobacteriota bacterium]